MPNQLDEEEENVGTPYWVVFVFGVLCGGAALSVVYAVFAFGLCR